MPIAIPNTRPRVRAVKVHDLNHVLTGHDANQTGEATISAFEIGAGCGDFVAAWLINLWGFAYGMLLTPPGLLRTFVRERRSCSLYQFAIDDDTLDRTVGACAGKFVCTRRKSTRRYLVAVRRSLSG